MTADHDGQLHVVYTGLTEDGHYGQAYLAEGGGRDWTTEAVPLGTTERIPSIAFDSDDSIHIANIGGGYTEYYNLRYVTDADGTWESRTFEFGANVLTARIAVDSTDSPLILTVVRSYESPDEVISIGMAGEEGVESDVYSLDEGWHFVSVSSIAADGDGRLHAILVRTETGSSWTADHLVFDSGAWTVSEGPDLGEGEPHFSHQSLAIDDAGDIHLTFSQDIGDGAVAMYAVERDGVWICETVGETGNYFLSPSIALDSTGTPHVAFMHAIDSSTEGTGYAVRVNGEWTYTEVDDRSPAFWSACSMVIDSNDGIHLCTGLPHDSGSSFDAAYITDSEPGLLTMDWITEAALVTALVATLVCIPTAAALHLWDKKRRKREELTAMGLHDGALK